MLKTKNEQKLLKEPVQNNHYKNIGTYFISENIKYNSNYELNPSGFQFFIKIKMVHILYKLY